MDFNTKKKKLNHKEGLEMYKELSITPNEMETLPASSAFYYGYLPYYDTILDEPDMNTGKKLSDIDT